MERENKIQQQSQSLYTRASVDASTVIENETERSFWVIFATENPVFRRGWEENFNEILLCAPENMRLDRLDAGAVPLLDNHDRWSGAKGQMGTVVEYKIESHVGRAKILFSTREEFKGIWDDIKAGIIKSISCGYNVYKYVRETVAEDKAIPFYRATDWEPMEISLAPVPADFLSKVRGEGYPAHDIVIENLSPVQNNRSNMKDENTVAGPENTATAQAEAGGRSAQSPSPAPAVPILPPAPLDENKIRSEAAQAERTRTADINKAVRAAKLDQAFADDLIERGVTIEAAREEIINKLAEGDTTPNVRNTNINVVGDERDNIRNAMTDALMHRAQPGSVKLEGKAHDYKYMSMLDLARQMLINNGESANRYSSSEVIKRAIATTDYPTLLTSTVDRTIRKTYELITPEWKQIARQTNAKDFREKTGIAVDGKVTFEEIAEGGEYKNSILLNDESAKIKLKTYGRKITITRQAIINDDLEVFGKLPSLIAYGAADFQAAKVWGLITGNKKTPDGNPIFHAAHKNLAAGAGNVGAPSEDLLSKARTAMFRQTTLAGSPMSIAPKWLIVPMELMMAAEKLMTAILATTTGDVNTFAGKLQIMTSPYLTNASEWYLAGDISRFEGLVYAYLEGEEGLFVDKEIDFNNDAVVTKARLDFDCAAWDSRPWYKNPGA